MPVEADPFKKAKGYALRLFKLRPRSCQELQEKLADKGFDTETSGRVKAFCLQCGLLDDRAFARVWLQGRIKRYGIRRIERELAAKGIPAEQTREIYRECGLEDSEDAVVREIVNRRLRVVGAVDPFICRRRLTDYLLRRGFGMDTITRVLKSI